ncbi:MAG: hypothetical protein M3373_02965 [Gemmatimonadota bacterium]|nr:hypothetical protein [Gemmatimonadota bacterium]
MKRRTITLLTASALITTTGCARAQHGQGHGSGHEHAHGGDPAAASVHEAVGRTTGSVHAAAHLQLTPVRPKRPGDDERAAEVLAQLRRGLAKYQDYRVAVEDGFAQFLPNVPQPVYHFTSTRRSIGEAFAFDPARPGSLLYEKAAGAYKLIGAMYHAPRRLSLEQLDERIPLSVARWHRHVNLCFPERGDEARWREARSGALLFGPQGTIATRQACEAERGRWVENLFGWMLHVNPLEEDPAKVWGSEHDHGGDHDR